MRAIRRPIPDGVLESSRPEPPACRHRGFLANSSSVSRNRNGVARHSLRHWSGVIAPVIVSLGIRPGSA